MGLQEEEHQELEQQDLDQPEEEQQEEGLAEKIEWEPKERVAMAPVEEDGEDLWQER